MVLTKTIKWLSAAVGALVVVGLVAVLSLLRTETPTERVAPLVPRLAADYPGPARIVGSMDLLDWATVETPLALINTATDRLPNGLPLSMLPFFVDWEGSRLEGQHAHVIVRNVNAGGNPVAGESLLATVRVPLRGLTELQWCLTPTRNKDDEDTFMGHAMLRFLFEPEHRPVILNELGEPLPRARRPDDLMLSWEAWRPPMTRYDGLKGMDPESYALSARAYTGEQRFLTDVVRGNPWKCWPVVLPDVDHAVATVLLTGLLVGDAMARRVIDEMARDGSLQVLGREDLLHLDPEQIERAQAVFSTSALPDDPMAALMGEADLTYQLLERSCITLSLGAIQLALMRIHRENDLGPAPRLRLVPERMPDWIYDLATADTGKLLSHLPGAVLFVTNNAQVLPSRAYRILEEAGLLQPGEDGPVLYYYDAATGTPYGAVQDNMM